MATETTAPAVTYADVEAAARRIAGYAHVTPVITSRTLNDQVGAELYLKCENLQRAGAFKFRGAFNRLSVLTPEERRRGVVAFSSGNHAQAVALSSHLLGIPAVIVMPHDAPATKVAATQGYGAEIVRYNRLTEDREAIARALGEERGLVVVPPYDDPYIIAGQGTAVHEMREQAPPLDMLVSCVGGGGLIGGSCLSARAIWPQIRIFGVEPEDGNDTYLSLQQGRIVSVPPPASIADGIRTLAPGTLTFPIEQEHLEAIVLVNDAEIKAALRFLLFRLKVLVEPTGAVAVAAILAGKVPVAGKRVGVILSGGNVDPDVLAGIIQEG
jgi:threo-3-hydroxy-L-aspartate ammonia-lyase